MLDRQDRARTLRLPRLEADGLYYTAVSAGGHLCATYCGGVRVVCQPLDEATPSRPVSEPDLPLR